MEKLNVAIIAQGRSGRNIHGAHFKSERNTLFNVVALVETDKVRREKALSEYSGCKVYENYTELYDCDNIDLVVNATYSNDHYVITKNLLEHNFNVVVEKPFARNRYECDNLIRIAKEHNVKLGVFQQSMLAAYYLGAQETIKSGKLGEIQQITIKFNGFARRWDWQTTQTRMGGGVYNTGPHPIGLALGFLDFTDDVKVEYSKLGRTLTSGDADDYAKIILTAPGKPVIDIEICSNDAFVDNTLRILGSKGSYVSTLNKYSMKYIKDGENPPRPVIFESITDENGVPNFCAEKLITHEETGEYPDDSFSVASMKFYEMMYNAITKDEPMCVPPEHAAKIISVIETVHAQNPLSVEY